MRWLDHLRGDTEAFNSFVAFLREQKEHAYQHFLNAKDMNGMERVKGRVEAMQSLEATLFEKERDADHAAERLAQRARAQSGTRLEH
jgi:hypothetical protein